MPKGLTVMLHTMPRELRSAPSFPEICRQCFCVLLHTSEKNEPFILAKDANGKVFKLEGISDDVTAVENRLRFARIFRKGFTRNIFVNCVVKPIAQYNKANVLINKIISTKSSCLVESILTIHLLLNSFLGKCKRWCMLP